MSRPLANLDYLITYQPNRAPDYRSPAGTADDRGIVSKAAAAVERAAEEAVVALGTPILTTLSKAAGKGTAFELVDELHVRLEDLFTVLDVLSRRFQWVDVDKTDPKGNYVVTLTQKGRDYLEKTIGVTKAK